MTNICDVATIWEKFTSDWERSQWSGAINVNNGLGIPVQQENEIQASMLVNFSSHLDSGWACEYCTQDMKLRDVWQTAPV